MDFAIILATSVSYKNGLFKPEKSEGAGISQSRRRDCFQDLPDVTAEMPFFLWDGWIALALSALDALTVPWGFAGWMALSALDAFCILIPDDSSFAKI